MQNAIYITEYGRITKFNSLTSGQNSLSNTIGNLFSFVYLCLLVTYLLANERGIKKTTD